MTDRRSFLKLAGFTIAGGVMVGCSPSKIERAIPMLVKPEELTPGQATWYATTCAGCSAACGVLAKNRDGRPIKLEGNPAHPLSKGGLCAVGQAGVLSLYDSLRLARPVKQGIPAPWESIDAEITAQLRDIAQHGGAVRILTGTITSPTQRAVIDKFLAQFPDARHIEFDPLSSSAILDAHLQTHGARVLPHYRFDQARVIASFDADFLGTWISPVEFTAAYRAGRNIERAPSEFSYHIQFESRLSLTGGKADRRVRITPNEMAPLLARLAELVAQRAGAGSNGASTTNPHEAVLAALAERLWAAREHGLVVCGANDIATQLIVNRINALLGGYGTTLDIAQPSYQRQGSDTAVHDLVEEIGAGSVQALFVHGVNPVYCLPGGAAIAQSIKTIPLVVSFSERIDETAAVAGYVCPDPHPLEQWNDAEPVAGVISITQPVISRLGNTRPFIESLSAWMNAPQSALEIMQAEWQRAVFPRRNCTSDFQSFWDASVEAGVVEVKPVLSAAGSYRAPAVSSNHDVIAGADGALAVVLYPNVAMLDGRHAHNPWLQELPDPISKIVWDNYAAISPATAQRLNVNEGDVLRLTATNDSSLTLDLPAHIQQGTHDGVAAIALGYGRKGTERFTNIGPQWLEAQPTVPPNELVGKNAALFMRFVDGAFSTAAASVTITKTGATRSLACTQEYHSLTMPANLAPAGAEPRPIIQETTLAALLADPKSGSFETDELTTMWPPVPAGPHKWGMAIDLTACTGCGACVVGCQAENNIPIVGKDEVGRNRELSWIRIDRYFEERGGETVIAHQPMMCQQCGNAPCETVCPVLATVHSEEGLNQQVYNRCVGTRYCANNCPYKVRHFNWFDYPHDDPMQRLVLNPDVTVRERGVMEKCSFCVQRIQEAKIEAKHAGVPLKDGDITPACMQSCPAQAITFGDMMDPNSALSRLQRNPRSYHVLEELGVRPSVGYLTLVRNAEAHEEAGNV